MATYKCPWCKSYKSSMKSSLRSHMRADCRNVPTQYRATAYDDMTAINELMIMIDTIADSTPVTNDYAGGGGTFGGGGASSDWGSDSSPSSSGAGDSGGGGGGGD